MAEFIKVTRKQIRTVSSISVTGYTPDDKDEMAIPSYLHSNPLIRWLMWQRYKKIFELARLNKDQHVLEFGCGIGLFLPTLGSNCKSVKAIDLFPQFAEYLCQLYRLDVTFPTSLSEIPDKSIDLIIAADVLEHLSLPDAVISEFVRILVNKGRLVVSGPTENLFYRIGRVLAGFRGKGDYHETDIRQLAPIIEQNGFVLHRMLKLPFPYLPCLFQVLEFGTSKPRQLDDESVQCRQIK